MQIIDGSKFVGVDDIQSTSASDRYNSAILPRHQVWSVNTSKVDYALGPSARKRLHAQTLLELQGVIKFFCLNLGCQHAHGESPLSSRSILTLPTIVGSCNNCSKCDGLWHNYFIPVFWCSAIAFIEWLMVTAKLPYWINMKGSISSILMSSVYWKDTIYDTALLGVSCANVDSLFLALAGSGILVIQHSVTDGLVWNMGRQTPVIQLHPHNIHVTLIEATIGVPSYALDSNWVGINQHPDASIRVCTSQLPLT